MLARMDYRLLFVGQWRLAVLADAWSPEIEQRVLQIVGAQPWAKHPQTIPFSFSEAGQPNEFYLKIFHPPRGGAACKDAFRSSKAFRAWRQGIALARTGFAVPVTIAAGERRVFRFLRCAFTLTKTIAGQPVPLFLRDWVDARDPKARMAAKRAGLKHLARLLRRFHQNGFVHGDLVASNILVSDAGPGGPVFYLMDNDRTRRYPAWMPQSLWKRNLVQLNRMPLPGITLQDRMRFFEAYFGRHELTGRDRKLAKWLERKTRQRRKECDGVDPSGDFRILMRCS
ncbi:MAG TPA: lipopolysaccharide kinase InaA family protein [Candidatus Binatia bacterium]|nr:lipopolysaccharide kinase InaA family protein [Candidatus Binatia bacterium]